MENYNTLNKQELVNCKNEKEKFLYEVEEDQFKLLQNLVKKRKEKNMTQKDIADKTGLTQQMVSRIEKYEHSPTLLNFLKYITALGLDINDIFRE